MKKTILLLVLLLFACGEQKDQVQVKGGVDKLKVISVNYPLHYFAQRIGGDVVDAQYPVAEKVDPAYWEPSTKEIVLYQEADLILLNGAGYAKWVEKVSLPPSKLYNTSLPFKDNYVEINEGLTHSHGPGGEHEHKGYAFITWLNFDNAIIQAEEVYKALSNLLPESQQTFKSNYESLKNELAELNQKMNTAATKFEGTTLFGSHPVYQYLSGGYNINIISFHWEPDAMPDNFEWDRFKSLTKVNPSTIMLWEDEPLPEVKQKIIDSGIKVVVFNPCGNKPASGDFLSVMNQNIQSLKASK
ncbi:MAG: zinc ABC transporter substrate-binding protein [Ignavibacterium sp.]|nr:MAG: zinc ABC transporter substrate-binding protein [Ignavibacterium sp.]